MINDLQYQQALYLRKRFTEICGRLGLHPSLHKISVFVDTKGVLHVGVKKPFYRVNSWMV